MVDFYYPILSCFGKMISVSDPIPVLVETILSVSENYPIVHCDAQHTFLCCVYFAPWGKIAIWGKITVRVILPSAEHDWLKQSTDKFGIHVLLSWPWHLQQLSPMHGWWLVSGLASSFLFALSQWFPNFFWSRTICGSYSVSTYHLVPGKVNVQNIIWSNVWKYFQHEQNVCENFCCHFQRQRGKYTKIQDFIYRIQSIKIIAVNIILV